MTYLKWLTTVERIAIKDYILMPNYIKEKFRANYVEYCETYNLAIA